MNKSVKILIIIMSMSIIALAAGLYFFFVKDTEHVNTEPSAEKIVECSLEIPEITTNLLNDDYIRISFTIQTDSKEAKEELEKRQFQVENVIIKTLSNLEAKDLEGTEGKDKLEDTLKKSIDDYLTKGEVVQVYITSAIIQ